MNARVYKFLARGINDCRLLFLVFLLLWGPACWSDETKPALKIALDNVIPAEMNEPHDGRMTQQPRVENLDKEIFRIGAITVDKAKRLITVPGKMIPYEKNKPIEFIATMKQGYKSYESVLMLETNAFEFNLACILIGLDPDKSSAPKYHFDPEPVEGDRLSIRVSWQKNDQWIEQDVVDLLKVGEEKPASPSVWAYTGSMFIEGDRYLAQMDGVLIGLVHDPASIIEHREGIGIGNFGIVSIDSESAPAGGQDIILTVQGLD